MKLMEMTSRDDGMPVMESPPGNASKGLLLLLQGCRCRVDGNLFSLLGRLTTILGNHSPSKRAHVACSSPAPRALRGALRPNRQASWNKRPTKWNARKEGMPIQRIRTTPLQNFTEATSIIPCFTLITYTLSCRPSRHFKHDASACLH